MDTYVLLNSTQADGPFTGYPRMVVGGIIDVWVWVVVHLDVRHSLGVGVAGLAAPGARVRGPWRDMSAACH